MKKIRLFVLLIFTCLVGLFAVACYQTLEFDYNIDFVVDGKVVATVGTNGDKIAMPKDPEKEDYTFDGWYWDEGEWEKEFTLNSLLDQPLQAENRYKVYAKFKSAVYYTVVFEYGNEEETQQIKYGEPTALRLNTFEHAEENYVFMGWENDGDLYEDGEVVLNLCEVGETVVLKAKWECDHGTYTVRYHANDGTGEIVSQTVANMKGDCFLENPFTAPQHKWFDRWSTYSNGTGTSYKGGQATPTRERGSVLDLYAQWKWADSVIKIEDGRQFQLYAGQTKNKVFVLTDSIENWNTPIGSPEQPFEGIFDGDGNSISGNVNEVLSTKDNRTYSGFFGYIGESGVVRNVKLQGSVRGEWTGAIATTNLGKIENIENWANVYVKGKNDYTRDRIGVAGIAAENTGIVRNCLCMGKVSNTSALSNDEVETGAICVRNYIYDYAQLEPIGGTIENNVFMGDLTIFESSAMRMVDAIAITIGAGIARNNYYHEDCFDQLIYFDDVWVDKSKGETPTTLLYVLFDNATNAGVATDDMLKTRSFYTDTLGWDETVWELSQFASQTFLQQKTSSWY